MLCFTKDYADHSHYFGPYFKSPQAGPLALVPLAPLVQFALGHVHLLAGRPDEHTCRNRQVAASESDGMMLQIYSKKQENNVYMNVMCDLHIYIPLLQSMISRD